MVKTLKQIGPVIDTNGKIARLTGALKWEAGKMIKMSNVAVP